MVVLDTATLLYWTLWEEELSSQANLTIKKSAQVVVSAISLWEIGIKVKKQKLTLPRPFEVYVDTLKAASSLTFLAVDVDIWVENVNLVWNHKDPADRTIVATAKRLGCPLITPDQAIRAFYADAIW